MAREDYEITIFADEGGHRGLIRRRDGRFFITAGALESGHVHREAFTMMHQSEAEALQDANEIADASKL
jgi:hypothetical protein